MRLTQTLCYLSVIQKKQNQRARTKTRKKKEYTPPQCSRPQAQRSAANKSHTLWQTIFAYSRPTSLRHPRRGWQSGISGIDQGLSTEQDDNPVPPLTQRCGTTTCAQINTIPPHPTPPVHYPPLTLAAPSLPSQPYRNLIATGTGQQYEIPDLCSTTVPAAQFLFARKIKHGHFGEDVRTAKKRHVRHTIHDTNRPLSHDTRYTGRQVPRGTVSPRR